MIIILIVIHFNEKLHKYTDDYGREYISATTILHKLEEPFDEQKMSLICARKEGVTQQEILDRWHAKRDASCNIGTAYHLVMENHINGNYCCIPVDPTPEEFRNMTRDFDGIIKNIMNVGDELRSEYRLYHEESLIAGTADLIIDHGDNEFSVGDFKTNERIEYSSKYGKFLLDDFSHLTDCNYTIYTLQMSLYAYMYSLLSGRRCRQLFLMWIDRMNGNRMHFIPAPYLYHDICRLIDKRKREIMMKK